MDFLFNLLAFALCVWILINIGARKPKTVKKVNKGIKNQAKRVGRSAKAFLKDDEPE